MSNCQFTYEGLSEVGYDGEFEHNPVFEPMLNFAILYSYRLHIRGE